MLTECDQLHFRSISWWIFQEELVPGAFAFVGVLDRNHGRSGDNRNEVRHGRVFDSSSATDAAIRPETDVLDPLYDSVGRWIAMFVVGVNLDQHVAS